MAQVTEEQLEDIEARFVQTAASMTSDLWGKGDKSSEEDPPTAVLSFADEGDRPPEGAVVVIQEPRLDGDGLTYSVEVRDGTVPAATGARALFMDPFGRPPSPVSAAGMHRRTRRRVRRGI